MPDSTHPPAPPPEYRLPSADSRYTTRPELLGPDVEVETAPNGTRWLHLGETCIGSVNRLYNESWGCYDSQRKLFDQRDDADQAQVEVVAAWRHRAARNRAAHNQAVQERTDRAARVKAAAR